MKRLSDASRAARAVARMGRGECAALLGTSDDRVTAVLGGSVPLTARERAILVLWGSADKSTRASCLRHLAREQAAILWRTIPGFEKYEASSAGEVRRAFFSNHAPTPRPLKPKMRSDGYLHVTLYRNDGRAKSMGVHRAVALAFHGEPAGVRYACHIDGVKTNNAAANLYWGTPAENARDTVRHRGPRPTPKIEPTGGKLGAMMRPAQIREAIISGNISRNNGLKMMRRFRRD